MDVTDPTKNRERWLAAIAAARDAAAVAELQTRLFGTKGEVLDFVRSVRSLPFRLHSVASPAWSSIASSASSASPAVSVSSASSVSSE